VPVAPPSEIASHALPLAPPEFAVVTVVPSLPPSAVLESGSATG
jgi:hypothetical protein